MSIPIAMPQLGLTMTEGTVSAWLKKPGDTVKKDEVLLTVSTDKVDMDVESPADGVLTEIIVNPGQTVPVGTQLAFLDAPGAKAAARAQARESAVSGEPNPVLGEPKAVKPSPDGGIDVLPITMPQLGLTMTEGAVSAWLKKPGEAVKKDEILLTVSTDKVDMDVESPADGTLGKIIVDPGQTVPVGTQLAYLHVPGTDSVALVQAHGSTVSSESKPVRAQPDAIMPSTRNGADALSTSDQDDRVKHVVASPRAKRAARKLGVDLSNLKGSGLGGRILEVDVQTAILKGTDQQADDTDVKRRLLIAARMVESITTIPAFSVSVEVNAENFVALYESLKEPVGRAASVKLTYTDLLLKALAVSLAKTPEMNMLWDGGALRRVAEINLGLAIATDHGVAAPTLTGVDHSPLEQLVRRRAELTDKARQRRLTFSDIEGAVGTLSNLGMYRVDRFEGIITPGQTFILALGRLKKRPWVEATLVVKPTLVLNLSVDHRVTDGATAAVFLERIADVIENPYQILWSAERK